MSVDRLERLGGRVIAIFVEPITIHPCGTLVRFPLAQSCRPRLCRACSLGRKGPKRRPSSLYVGQRLDEPALGFSRILRGEAELLLALAYQWQQVPGTLLRSQYMPVFGCVMARVMCTTQVYHWGGVNACFCREPRHWRHLGCRWRRGRDSPPLQVIRWLSTDFSAYSVSPFCAWRQPVSASRSL